MKKTKKLSLRKVTIKQLGTTTGGWYYGSYMAGCSNSCHTCQDAEECGRYPDYFTELYCYLTQGGCSPI